MKTLSQIKKDMEFNKDLTVLIEALKSIAIGEYYALEKKIKFYKKYLASVESFFEYIDVDAINHPFVKPQTHKQAVIAITSDAGFLGGVNMRVVHAALHEAENMPTTLLVVGERGKMYIPSGLHSLVSFPGISEESRFEQSIQMRNYLVKQVLSGAYDTVKLVYPKPVSMMVQHVEVVQFLPFRPSNTKLAPPAVIANTIMESRLEDTVEYLVTLWMGEMLFEIFGLSRLAEFSARYFHLEESNEKLNDENKKIQLQYFRIRHELIDRSMRELFAGRATRGC